MEQESTAVLAVLHDGNAINFAGIQSNSIVRVKASIVRIKSTDAGAR